MIWWTSAFDPTSMPARRLVEDEHARMRVQPLAQDDLLLVAARQRRHRHADRRRADAQPLPIGVGGGLLGRPAGSRPRRSRYRSSDRQRDVRGDRHREDESQRPAVLGRVGDPQPQRVLRVADRDRPAVEEDLAACRPGRCRTGPGRRRSGGRRRGRQSPGPRPRAGRTRCRGTRPRAPARGPRGRRRRASTGVRWKNSRQRPADHLADGDRRGQLRPRPGRHPAAVAQDGHAVGDLEDLLHAMRDEQDGDALAARRDSTIPNSRRTSWADSEAVGSSMIRTRTCSESALAISTVCCSARVRPRAGSSTSSRTPSRAEDRLGVPAHPATIDQAAAIAMADEDVLGDGQVREAHRLLVDRRDAERLGLRGALAERHLGAVDQRSRPRRVARRRS